MKEKVLFNFIFKRINYILLLIGCALISIGLFLMIGGGSEDPNIWNPKVVDTAITSPILSIGPICISLGFIIQIFAIMYRGKEK